MGDAAKLAAAVLALRHAVQLATETGDRLLVAVAREPQSFGLGVPPTIEHARAECAAVEARVTAARAHVNRVKEAIRQRRIAAGSRDAAERALQRVDTILASPR
jgi:hypothetical protein